jgi:hypothetical protein
MILTLPKLIGFSGYRGSGKDTAAEVLRLQCGHQRRPFAGPLKAMLRALLSVQGVEPDHIEEMLEGRLKEVPSTFLGGKTPRHAMQTLGTEWGRGLIGPTYWLEAWDRSLQTASLVVVTDVRFPNEADEIERRGGFMIHIDRFSLAVNDNHDSEKHVPELRRRARLRVPNDFRTKDEFQTHFCKVLQAWGVDAA